MNNLEQDHLKGYPKYIEDQLAEEIIAHKMVEGTVVNVGHDAKRMK